MQLSEEIEKQNKSIRKQTLEQVKLIHEHPV